MGAATAPLPLASGPGQAKLGVAGGGGDLAVPIIPLAAKRRKRGTVRGVEIIKGA